MEKTNNKIFIVDDITMEMLRRDKDINPMLEELSETEDEKKMDEIVDRIESTIKEKFGVEEIYFAN